MIRHESAGSELHYFKGLLIYLPILSSSRCFFHISKDIVHIITTTLLRSRNAQIWATVDQKDLVLVVPSTMHVFSHVLSWPNVGYVTLF